jgi:hypothetical protein
MPEMLFFLLELTRAYKPPPHAHPAPPASFLANVVRPIVACIYAETFETDGQGRAVPKRDDLRNFPRNYDDCARAITPHTCACDSHHTTHVCMRQP